MFDDDFGLHCCIDHGSSCAVCHGGGVASSGAGAPDLRESDLVADIDIFNAIVRDGSLLPLGMPKFDDLDEDELRAIQEYILQETKNAATHLEH